uniref:hypothetical protein n=1 Tax=Candidatus Phytoplasma asiaticum TaxID=2763338 RepID=UPI00201270DC|nr:hypothetical protein ['Parthenium hysterophorus' phyllody phytoplasma]
MKTLARKWKTSIARVRKKLNRGSTWAIPYLNKGKTQYEPWVVYSWDKIKKMRNYKGNPDITINRYIFQSRTHLTKRNVVRTATKQPNFKFITLGQFAMRIAKAS